MRRSHQLSLFCYFRCGFWFGSVSNVRNGIRRCHSFRYDQDSIYLPKADLALLYKRPGCLVDHKRGKWLMNEILRPCCDQSINQQSSSISSAYTTLPRILTTAEVCISNWPRHTETRVQTDQSFWWVAGGCLIELLVLQDQIHQNRIKRNGNVKKCIRHLIAWWVFHSVSEWFIPLTPPPLRSAPWTMLELISTVLFNSNCPMTGIHSLSASGWSLVSLFVWLTWCLTRWLTERSSAGWEQI